MVRRGQRQVQVLQYVPHPQAVYDPLTERMQQELDIRRYDVTAMVNLDASSGFTKPFVRSAVVDEQRVLYPATMCSMKTVLDWPSGS